jgi:hypothetical protein
MPLVSFFYHLHVISDFACSTPIPSCFPIHQSPSMLVVLPWRYLVCPIHHPILRHSPPGDLILKKILTLALSFPIVLNLIPTVSAYKIQAGLTILLIDSRPVPSPSSASAAASTVPKTEASTIQAIQAELAAVRGTLEPSVDAFLRTPTVDAEHTRLGELLLQALLRLDALSIDNTWVDARRERKGAVSAVQGILDHLDKGWREAKAQAQTQNGAEP